MIRFSSKAGADVWMLAEHGRKLLDILGKDSEASRGVIPADDAARAIDRIKVAIAAEPPPPRLPPDPDDPGAPPQPDPEFVALHQRAFPLLELLEAAARKKKDVIWGW